jgi:membrane fusion protein (multidrug efflux system)
VLRALALLALAFAACKKAPPPPPPPPIVQVAPAQAKSVEQTFEWVATLDGSINAEIRPQISGIIEKVPYTEGTMVQQGMVLFSIDRRPFAAAVQKARGDYEAAVAMLGKARADVERYRPLVEKRAISREELDNANAAVRTGVGNVAAAKGALQNAELNLEWTDVRSPITGLAGIAQARVGNLVGPSQVLTVVSQVDPIRGSVHISEREYLNAAEILNNVNDPKYANRRYIELVLINGKIHPYRAQRVIVAREIDPTTGTLTIQTLFPNPGNILRPGMFARSRVHTGRPVDVLLVPEQAVSQLQGLYQVSVVDQNRVQQRNIQTGRQIDHQVVVERGLRPGELVIVEGQQKAPPGARVNPQAAKPDGGQ